MLTAALISMSGLVGASDASANNNPYMVLVNYGALGIMLLLVATGQFRTKAEVQRLETQASEYREIIKTFQMQLTTQTLPAMSKSAQVLEAIPDREITIYEELKATQAETKKILERLENLASTPKPKPGRK